MRRKIARLTEAFFTLFLPHITASFQPASPQIVDDEQEGSHCPGQRIAESYSGDFRAQRNGGQNPCHTQNTDANGSHQHGRNGVPASPCRSSEDFNADISNIARRNDFHHSKPNGNDIRVICKHAEENTAAGQYDNA